MCVYVCVCVCLCVWCVWWVWHSYGQFRKRKKRIQTHQKHWIFQFERRRMVERKKRWPLTGESTRLKVIIIIQHIVRHWHIGSEEHTHPCASRDITRREKMNVISGIKRQKRKTEHKPRVVLSEWITGNLTFHRESRIKITAAKLQRGIVLLKNCLHSDFNGGLKADHLHLLDRPYPNATHTRTHTHTHTHLTRQVGRYSAGVRWSKNREGAYSHKSSPPGRIYRNHYTFFSVFIHNSTLLPLRPGWSPV